MKRDDKKAIVISDDHYNALGMIRSIGECGIPVVLLLTTEKEETFVNLSKYITYYEKIGYIERDIIEAINRHSKDSLQTFLFPLSDFSAELLDRYRESFNNFVCVPNMNGMMRVYQDKQYSREKAKEAGIRIPQGQVVEDNSIVERWTCFPAIVKPLNSVDGLKSDITTVKNEEEMQLVLNSFWEKGYKKVLVEEFIEGIDEHMLEVMGCANKEGVHIAGIIQKIREYPINNGSTAYAKIIKEHVDLDVGKIVQYICSVGYDGLFDMEFKYADGKVYFIECNFRNGAPGYIFSKLGRNMPARWMGIQSWDSKNILSEKNIYFMCENMDVLNMVKKNISFFQWLKQFCLSKKIFFMWTDIKPVIKYYYHFAGIAFRRIRKGN